MISLMLSLMAALPAPAAEMSARTTFVSVRTREALVRVHSAGQFTVLRCQIPRGPILDISFATEGAMQGCAAARAWLPDTEDARAAFAAEFERTLVTRARSLSTRFTGRTLLTAGAVGVIVGATLAYVVPSRYIPAGPVVFTEVPRWLGLKPLVVPRRAALAMVAAYLGATLPPVLMGTWTANDIQKGWVLSEVSAVPTSAGGELPVLMNNRQGFDEIDLITQLILTEQAKAPASPH